jgi:hypothetical protein
LTFGTVFDTIFIQKTTLENRMNHHAHHDIPHKRSTRKAAPASLNELVWGCALDDHLYEEEKGELEKATGKKESSGLLNFLGCYALSSSDTEDEDPRQVRMPNASSATDRGEIYPGAINEFVDDEIPPL